MRVRDRLRAIDIRKLAKEPGLHSDGNGLALKVSDDLKQRYWVLRYSLHGQAHWMGLGSLDVLGLDEARTKAIEARRLILDGIDPIAERKARFAQQRLEAATAITFRACAEQYIAAYEKSWRNAKHKQQWESTLLAYAYPLIGNLPVGKIDTPQVLQVLNPIWATKPETAGRVRGRIEAVLDYATVAKYRPAGLNPARWKGNLDKMLPARSKIAKVEHHEAMTYDALPAFTVALRKQEGNPARALELLILTASRTGEVLGAQWPEIDLATKTWTIPGERMKAGREHVIPLSARSVAILEGMKAKATGSYVFPGRDAKRPLSNMALLMLLRRMGQGKVTAHGFRSTFRDWAGDRTAFDRETVEFALSHNLPDKVEAAYRRGTGLEKRRQLMTAWADYCAAPVPATADNVISIRA